MRETLQGWGQTIEPPALQLLLTRAGTELRRLQIEVDKLSLLIGDRGVIRVADVELLTPKLAEESVFRLADAVAARNGALALAVLRELMEGQLESPYRIFPLIIRQFRLIWQTKVLLDAGWKPHSRPGAVSPRRWRCCRNKMPSRKSPAGWARAWRRPRGNSPGRNCARPTRHCWRATWPAKPSKAFPARKWTSRWRCCV